MHDHVVMTSEQIAASIRDIAEKAWESAGKEGLSVIGVQTRGVHLADRIRAQIEKISGSSVNHGVLDITFHRDDLASRGSLPVIKETKINFDIDGKTVLLVDDVLFTGRTVKAALDTLTDYGRPKRILLAVLVDRGNRELPIQADFSGLRIETCFGDDVAVHLVESDGSDRVLLIEGGRK